MHNSKAVLREEIGACRAVSDVSLHAVVGVNTDDVESLYVLVVERVGEGSHAYFDDYCTGSLSLSPLVPRQPPTTVLPKVF